MSSLTPSRPYLLRAYYEWLMDNRLTPHVVVDATVKGTMVPQQYVRDGQIVLNIAESAVGQLQLGNDAVEFNARFGGVPQHVVLPMAAIVAIYARENGAGTVFDGEDAYLLEEGEDEFFTAAETDIDSEQSTAQDLGSNGFESDLHSNSADTDTTATQHSTPKPSSPKRRGHLTVVK